VRRIIGAVAALLVLAGAARADQWKFFIEYSRIRQNPSDVYAPPEHLHGLPPAIFAPLPANEAGRFPIGRRVYPRQMSATTAAALHDVAAAYVVAHVDRYPAYDAVGGVRLLWAQRVGAGGDEGGGGTPSTTTTTTTSPRGTTTTLAGMAPVRFRFGDVGRHYPDSQEINWRVDNGQRANQYYAWTRMRTLHFVVEPRVFRLMRDIPSCGRDGIMSKVRTIPVVDVSKFIFNYVLRPVRANQPYTVHPNYEWDIPQNWLDLFAACLLSDPVANAKNPLVTPDILQLLDLRVENGRLVEGDPTYCDPAVRRCSATGGVAHAPSRTPIDLRSLSKGLVDPRIPNKPLTKAQCAALMDQHMAHQAHAQALLDRTKVCQGGPHDGVGCQDASTCGGVACVDLAPIIGAQVVAKQLAFEATARNVHEQTLFSLIFIGDIDPARDPASIEALTRQTLTAHERWMVGFNCHTGKAPNTVKIIEGEFDHARAHFLRALYLPGVCLRTICDKPISSCPCTNEAN
jgi:hypothetical protein